MNESVTCVTSSPNKYIDFIKEVFIAPIRTAVVVDDEFPTLDEFLSDTNDQETMEDKKASEEDEKAYDLKRKKRLNRPTVREILKFCRNRTPIPWLVDVHDGSTPPLEKESDGIARLDHSDLLILDYHLESNGSGQKAIEILQHLASSGHFNLVVVYTKEREEAGAGIDRTINDIALSLASPVDSLTLHHKKVENFENKIEDWSSIQGQNNIYGNLLDSLDEIAFLKILEQEDIVWSSVRTLPELAYLADILNTIPENIGLCANDVFLLLMHKKQDEFRRKMAKGSYGRIATGKQENAVNWIRTDSLFVTVISKEHDASTIPDRLLAALEAWDPTPHRLIMSKMRNEIDQHGVIAEAGVLKNRHLQAGWLKEILEADEAKRRTNVRLNVARHWESLGGEIESKVIDFAEKVASYLLQPGISEHVLNRFDHDGANIEEQNVYLQLNCHACSKPVEGHHLSTGHVLKIKFGKNLFQYWLCLTPACDLEPGRKDDQGWKKRLGTWLPFKAVRLYHADKTKALQDATRAHFLFLQIENKLEVFGFAENITVPDSELPALRWEQCFAAHNGVFLASKELMIGYIGKNGTLNHEERQAVVVAQLRYEYALNLMQRLGSHLSRVGLDFNSYPSRESGG